MPELPDVEAYIEALRARVVGQELRGIRLANPFLLRTVDPPPSSEKVTAFRPEFAVHGRYGHPCPVCGTPVQRIVYGENESNYCPRCQTGGRVLADRALSRLLKDDWPRTVEQLERRLPGKWVAGQGYLPTREAATGHRAAAQALDRLWREVGPIGVKARDLVAEGRRR